MNGILYLEGACGISGDMTVAALLDLGGSADKLDKVLHSLNLDGFHYTVSRKSSYGIAGCDFDVRLREADEHHHDEHHHDEHHHDEHHSHHHRHEHRNLADVYAVIDRGVMTARASGLAKKIFRIVADAEAKAHGCPVEDVHFHEVGAIDSIVDIVAVSVLIDDLDIAACVVTGLNEGTGFVHCQHGDLPVPVPAVLNIAAASGIALRPTETRGEMVTPTGIAIAAALRTASELPAGYTVQKVGIGLGKRDFGRANLLRAMLIEPASEPERIWVLESNIDDSTGEELALAMEELFQAGARDVHFMPCFMKKNRPAYLLRVVADEKILPSVEETVFRTTTAIGLRKFPVTRTRMDREMVKVELPTGPILVKRCSFGGLVRNYPEYESVKDAALASGVPFHTMYEKARKAAETTDGKVPHS